MKKKKLLIPMALTAMISMTLPVFATQNITTQSSKNVVVSHNVGESYTVSIPADFTFSTEDQQTYTANKTVTATDVVIENGKKLNVKMTSKNYTDGKYFMKDKTNVSEIEYSILKGADEFENDTNVLSVESGNTSGEQELTFSTTSTNIESAKKSGEHTDTLTFTVSVD